MADLKVLKQITSSENSNEGINEPKVAIYVDQEGEQQPVKLTEKNERPIDSAE